MDSFVLKFNFGVKYIMRIYCYCKLFDCIIIDYGGVCYFFCCMCKILVEWLVDWNLVVF